MLPGYYLSPDIESNCVGLLEFCNQSPISPFWGGLIWFIAIDVVAGVACGSLCIFISFQIDTEQCSALDNNIGDFYYLLPLTPLVHGRYCMHRACVKLHLCMYLRVYVPVHAVFLMDLLHTSPTASSLEVKKQVLGCWLAHLVECAPHGQRLSPCCRGPRVWNLTCGPLLHAILHAPYLSSFILSFMYFMYFFWGVRQS